MVIDKLCSTGAVGHTGAISSAYPHNHPHTSRLSRLYRSECMLCLGGTNDRVVLKRCLVIHGAQVANGTRQRVQCGVQCPS